MNIFKVAAMIMVIVSFSYAQNTLSGIIKSYYIGTAIDSCKIQLIPKMQGKEDSTLTDAQGRFVLGNITIGIYKLRFIRPNFSPDSVDITISKDTAITFELVLATHKYDNQTALPDTIRKSYSPVFIVSDLQVQHPLRIEPGVHIVLLGDSARLQVGEITAVGSTTDSIVFISSFVGEPIGRLRAAQCRITISGGASSVHSFKFCRFFYVEMISIKNDQKAVFENCNFSYMDHAVYGEIDSLVFAKNIVTNCDYGGLYIEQHNTLNLSYARITDNLISSRLDPLCLTSIDRIYLRRNTILGPEGLDIGRGGYLSAEDTIMSNILSEVWFYEIANHEFNFSFNDVRTYGNNRPVGVGGNALRNAQGDSCDFYYNISKDPLISNLTTGELFNSSPCIHTGLDGENIGVYQGMGVTSTKEPLQSNANRKPDKRNCSKILAGLKSSKHNSFSIQDARLYDLIGRTFQIRGNSQKSPDILLIRKIKNTNDAH